MFLKNSVLTWKYKLISTGNKEIIRKEYDNTMFQLLIYETEFQNAVHLKPYCNVLLDIIKDIRNEISILTVYFKENGVTSEYPSTIYNEPLPFDKENNFNGVPLKVVKAHFERLTTLKSKKNNKPHLTQEQLNQFIEIAFLTESGADEGRQKISKTEIV